MKSPVQEFFVNFSSPQELLYFSVCARFLSLALMESTKLIEGPPGIWKGYDNFEVFLNTR